MNGRPVTAQDVVWSFDHFMKVSPQKTTFNQVASVTAPDERTVQFTLKDVYAPFEAQIGAPVFWIMPREVIEQDGDATKRVVGSGPFIFDKYDSGISFTGKKNPNYYRKGEPHVDELRRPDHPRHGHPDGRLARPRAGLPAGRRTKPEIAG